MLYIIWPISAVRNFFLGQVLKTQHAHQPAAVQYRKPPYTVFGEFESGLMYIVAWIYRDGRCGHKSLCIMSFISSHEHIPVGYDSQQMILTVAYRYYTYIFTPHYKTYLVISVFRPDRNNGSGHQIFYQHFILLWIIYLCRIQDYNVPILYFYVIIWRWLYCASRRIL